MISAWRRLINKNETNPENASAGQASQNGLCNGTLAPGIHKLDKELQRKFARGVNYNMKVVIKGDARVGKTSLFMRLKGHGFQEDCAPTETLNVTSIDWNYKATDDVVKIDLWEAADCGSKRAQVNFVDLKTSEDGTTEDNTNIRSQANNDMKVSTTVIATPMANATYIPESLRQRLASLQDCYDVYKGANAVMLVMDMTKLWTFKYVQNELSKIPKDIPVLIIANHRDQGHHRTVSAEQVRALIDSSDRTPADGIIMYTEASMKNGFGLKLIEKFLNIPFLRLQEATLLKQLELNRSEAMTTLDEIKLMQESLNQEYENHLELQTVIRRQQADAMSPVNHGPRKLDEATREQIRNATMSSDQTNDKSNVRAIESSNHSNKNMSDAQLAASQNFKDDRLASIVMGAKNPLPELKVAQLRTSSPAQTRASGDSAKQIAGSAKQTATKDDDKTNENNAEQDDSEEDEEPRANPLVATYQSDLDSDDQVSETGGVNATISNDGVERVQDAERREHD